jgi:hypothetical protein
MRHDGDGSLGGVAQFVRMVGEMLEWQVSGVLQVALLTDEVLYSAANRTKDSSSAPKPATSSNSLVL